MSSRFADSVALAILRIGSRAEGARRDSRLEEEVVALFDQFREPLLRYLSTFGLEMADREDVIQETFLALFQHLQRGKSRENLRAWLFRVGHNIALKRRLQNRRQFDGMGGDEIAADPALGPERQALEGEKRERLFAVVAALPELDRRCLFLRAEGLRYREIASVLEMSLGAVSLSLSRSVARMTRAVERCI